jgi:hypothetical protein
MVSASSAGSLAVLAGLVSAASADSPAVLAGLGDSFD